MTVTAPPRTLITGEQRPRLFTCPPYATSAGADVIELAGKAGLFLDDWQRWFLTQAQGERDPDGKWAAFAVALICSRQNGKDVILEARQLAGLFAFGETLIIHTAHEFKDLDLATPVLTASRGWVTMGTLRSGDEVFAPDGQPTKIVRVHPVLRDSDCYRVRLADGQEIVAGDGHLWQVTEARRDGSTRERTVTTGEMRRAGLAHEWHRSNSRDRRTWRWRLALPAPPDLPEADLPVDPWLLGAWLGDGDRNAGRITTGAADLPHMTAQLDALGWRHVTAADPRTAGRVFTVRVHGLRGQLRAAGVLAAKRIPGAYLTASIAQRRALLAGLLDTDGTTNGSQVIITMMSRPLMEDVLALVRSLGYRASLRTFRASLNGRDARPMHRVQFAAGQTRPFRLARKNAQLAPAQPGRSQYNAIIAIDRVATRPTRCITVAHESGCWLAGRGLIPTHNTAQEAYLRILQLIEGYPDLDQEVARTPASHGEEGIILKPTATIITGAGGHQITRSRTARLRFLARHKGAGRGFTGDLVIYNEAMYLDSEPVAASLPTMAQRMNFTDGGPQVWYTASAGVGAASQQLARVRERGIAGGTRTCFAEWSAELCDETCPPGCDAHDDPDTPQAAAKANPAYNLPGRYDPEMVENFRGQMDRPVFLREILGAGTYPVPAEGWAVIPKTWWTGTMAGDDQRAARPVFAIDTTPDRAYTSVAACGIPGGTDKPRIELCDHRAGQRWAAGYAASLDERRGPGVWVVDKGAAAGTLIGALEDAGLRVECPTATDVAHACGRLYDALRDREVDHACDKEVQTGLAGLARRRLGAGFAWDRNAAVVDISGVYAYTFAFWGWEKFGGHPGDYDMGESVGFGQAQIMALFTSGTYGPVELRRMRGRGLITDDMLTELARAGVGIPAGL